jgi:hypothetical protein
MFMGRILCNLINQISFFYQDLFYFSGVKKIEMLFLSNEKSKDITHFSK